MAIGVRICIFILYSFIGCSICLGSSVEKSAKLLINQYTTSTATREVLCTVFLDITSTPIVEILQTNMMIMGKYCDFAVISYKCKGGAPLELNSMATKANTILALYRCAENTHTHNKFLQKSVLFNRLLDVTKLYKRIWILDEDISFESFSPVEFFTNAYCGFAPDPEPIVVQPAVFKKDSKQNYLYYGYWKDTNVTVASVRYMSFQAPLMHAQFFEWFILHILRPCMHHSLAVFNDVSFSYLLCNAARSFAKGYYGNSQLNPSSYHACLLTTTDSTSVYHFESDIYWNRASSIKIERSEQALVVHFPSFYFKEEFTVPLMPANITHAANACPTATSILSFAHKDIGTTKIVNENDSGRRDIAKLYTIRKTTLAWVNSLPKPVEPNPNAVSKVYALYFPQFHRDRLNDKLWGQGYTDWDRVSSSPGVNRAGNSLARPSSLGYYDLVEKTPRAKQGSIAKYFKVDGFIYHHYYFYEPGQGAVLSAPLEALLNDNEPNISFALNWANVDWTVTWQGGSNSNLTAGKILQRQYCPSNMTMIHEHFQFLRRFFMHPNYIRIQGVPLFLLYKADSLSCRLLLTKLRELAMAAGFPSPGLHLPQMRSNVDHEVNAPWSKKVQEQFLLHKVLDNETIAKLNSNVASKVPKSTTNEGLFPMFDSDLYYPKGHSFMRVELPQRCLQGVRGNETRPAYLSVITMFDNTPRRFEATLWDRSWESIPAPLAYERDVVLSMYYEMCCQHDDVRAAGGKFIVINAWNEWGEGMILEPSFKYGVTYLEATQRAKMMMEKIGCSATLLNKYLELLKK